MASEVTVCGSRIANATRSWQADEDADVTDWNKSNPFIIAVAIQADSGHGGFGDNVRLEWQKDGGTWYPLASTGELNWAATTDLVNDDGVTSGEEGCTGAGTRVDGVEREGANDVIPTLSLDEWCELQFAIECSGAAAGSKYTFRLYNTTDAVSEGTCLAEVTIAAAGDVTIEVPNAAASFTSQTPDVDNPQGMIVPNTSPVFTSLVPTILNPWLATVPTSTPAFTSQVPDVDNPQGMIVPNATPGFTSYAPDVDNPWTDTVPNAAASFTSYAPVADYPSAIETIITMPLWTPKQGKPRFEYHVKLNPDHPLNRGLVGLWIFNEAGEILFDLSKSNLRLQRSGTVTWGNYNGKYCAKFDGSSGRFEKDVAAVLTAPLTMGVKVLTYSNPSPHQMPFTIVDKDVGDNGFLLRLRDTNNFQAVSYDGSFALSEVGTWATNTWHECVGVYASAASRIAYIDGKAGIENTTSITPAGLDRTSLGRWGQVSPGAYLDGLIEYAYCYDRALSAKEVKQLYEEFWGTAENPRFLIEPRKIHIYCEAPEDVTIEVPNSAPAFTSQAPTVLNPWAAIVPNATPAFSSYVPGVEATAHKWVEVPETTPAFSSYVPTVEATAHQWIEVENAAPSFTSYAPTAVNPWTGTVPQADILLTSQVPTIINSVTVEVPEAGAVFTSFVPTIEATANQWIEVPNATPAFISYVPSIVNPWIGTVPQADIFFTSLVPIVINAVTIQVPESIPAFSSLVPTIDLTEHVTIEVAETDMVFIGQAPTILNPWTGIIPPAGMVFTSQQPTVVNPFTVQVPESDMLFAGTIPTIDLTDNWFEEIPIASMLFTGQAPALDFTRFIQVATAAMIMQTYEPSLIGVEVPHSAWIARTPREWKVHESRRHLQTQRSRSSTSESDAGNQR